MKALLIFVTLASLTSTALAGQGMSVLVLKVQSHSPNGRGTLWVTLRGTRSNSRGRCGPPVVGGCAIGT